MISGGMIADNHITKTARRVITTQRAENLQSNTMNNLINNLRSHLTKTKYY